MWTNEGPRWRRVHEAMEQSGNRARSAAKSASARTALLEGLSAGLSAAEDLAAMRVAMEAIGKLLDALAMGRRQGTRGAELAGGVIDFAVERTRRGVTAWSGSRGGRAGGQEHEARAAETKILQKCKQKVTSSAKWRGRYISLGARGVGFAPWRLSNSGASYGP